MSIIFLEINWKHDYLSWPQNYHLHLLLQSNWSYSYGTWLYTEKAPEKNPKILAYSLPNFNLWTGAKFMRSRNIRWELVSRAKRQVGDKKSTWGEWWWDMENCIYLLETEVKKQNSIMFPLALAQNPC